MARVRWSEITLSALGRALREKSAFPVRCVVVRLLVATGITPDGQRTILGVSVSLSEAEVHWRKNFLASLQTRGLHGVRLIVSDDHQGIKAAPLQSPLRRRVLATLPVSPWPRTCYGLRAAERPFPRRGQRRGCRLVFNAPNRARSRPAAGDGDPEVPSRGAQACTAWLEGNVPEGLTVFDFPAEHRRRLRTEQHAGAGSIARSNAAPAWRRCSPTKASLLRFWPLRGADGNGLKSGRPKNDTYQRRTSSPPPKKHFTETGLHYPNPSPTSETICDSESARIFPDASASRCHGSA